MATPFTRKRFVQASAVAGAGIAFDDPIAALARRQVRGRRAAKAKGYGPIAPRAEQTTGQAMLALPAGFTYRIVQRSGDRMSDGNPCPGIFDGMAAYPGRNGDVVLIRNHENRSRPGEIPVVVPTGKRYDPDVNVRGGNTKLRVSKQGELLESFGVLGGTHTNCAGGTTPWDTWITCEEIFDYGATESNVAPGTGVPHGYIFRVPAAARGPVTPQPVKEAGRFSHEATAWLNHRLYLTEDRGDAAFYRFTPARRPREYGDLADFGGTLQALRVKGRPNFDANTATPGDAFDVTWVDIEEPNPNEDTVRYQAQARGAAIFDRTEGIWTRGGSVVFDCTTGGEAQLGQLWEYKPTGPDGGRLRLVYESTSAEDLENPDNLVTVPATRDTFLQEDGDGEQFVRGVTGAGAIYDFAKTLVNTTEFCGGCFSPDGRTFFLNQQGDRLEPGVDPAAQPLSAAAITYAIRGPFDERG